MKLVEQLGETGDLLFRWRSWLPLLLVPLFIASLAGLTYPRGSHGLDFWWEISCFAVSVLGIVIRVITVGTAPRGTSGRNTRAQKATVLNTTGPYSVVRHPLYLANYLIVLGMSLFTRTWFLPIIVSLATLLYYERIAAREEAFLESRFGEAFRQWAAQVPAAIPRPNGWRPAALPFSWGRALGREFYAISEVAIAFFVLDIAEDWMVHHRLALDSLWTTMAIAGGVFFVVMRTRKKLHRAR